METRADTELINLLGSHDGQPIDFFYTYAVIAVSDPSTGSELYRAEFKVDQEQVFGDWTKDTIKKLLAAGDPHVLPHIPIVISMNSRIASGHSRSASL